MQGIVEIGGNKFVERLQVFPSEVAVTVNNQVQDNLSLVLPGIAGFWLKGLTAQVVAANVPAVRLYRFRFRNSDGGVNYVGGGVGAASSRVVNNLITGTGQFPFPIIPHIYFSPTGSILYEIEDLSANVPYTIYFGWHGSFLIPY